MKSPTPPSHFQHKQESAPAREIVESVESEKLTVRAAWRQKAKGEGSTRRIREEDKP